MFKKFTKNKLLSLEIISGEQRSKTELYGEVLIRKY